MSRRDDPESPSAPAERWRCFVAVELADPARSAVVEYLERLRATVAGVGWTRATQLHLTLTFLGDVETPRIPPLAERIRAALAAEPARVARVRGVGAFPSLARPQVIWVGIEAPRLGALANAVESACAEEGFAREARPFRPHVTLGRVRDRRPRPDLGFLASDGDRELGNAPLMHVTLFRSELGAGGARHSVLATFPLIDAGSRFA